MTEKKPSLQQLSQTVLQLNAIVSVLTVRSDNAKILIFSNIENVKPFFLVKTHYLISRISNLYKCAQILANRATNLFANVIF